MLRYAVRDHAVQRAEQHALCQLYQGVRRWPVYCYELFRHLGPGLRDLHSLRSQLLPERTLHAVLQGEMRAVHQSVSCRAVHGQSLLRNERHRVQDVQQHDLSGGNAVQVSGVHDGSRHVVQQLQHVVCPGLLQVHRMRGVKRSEMLAVQLLHHWKIPDKLMQQYNRHCLQDLLNLP